MFNLSSLSGNRFVVIGRAGMDFYPEPAGTKTEDATQFFASLGGSSANICVAIQKHGGETSLVTCVSDDAVGRFCIKQLEQYGVDATYVRPQDGEYRNSLAVSESRVEDHQTVIYRNGAADFQMNKEDIDTIDFSPYCALITTGTVLAAEPSRTAAFYAFEQAKAKGLGLIFDVDYRPYSWASADEAAEVYSSAGAMCDIIIGNDVEFGFMAGDYDQGLDKARELAHSTASVVVYKMGEKGAITITSDEEFQTGIYPAEALKPTGAGDSFMGGFIASLANGYPLKESVLRGSACASIVVSRVGCAPAMPTPTQLDEFLAANASKLTA